MVTEDIREVVRRADGITEFLAVCNRIHVVPEIRENNLTYLYTEKTVSILGGLITAKTKTKYQKKQIYLAVCALICTQKATYMELQLIDRQVNEILNGTRDLLQFNQPEHAWVCSAGPLLVCDIARESISSSINAWGGKITPSNWEIDEAQEREVQAWAEAKGVWVPQADKWLEAKYGPMIAQGAEAKVYGCTGDTHVVKERASIYATLGRAL